MKFVSLLSGILLSSMLMAQGNISIIGNGYSFTVADPSGWVRDMKNAQNMFANVLYYPLGQSPSTQTTMILVTLNRKKGDGLHIMMENEMSDYMKEKPNVQYEVMEIPHPEYETNTQCAFVENDFYHYITYIEPGEDIKSGLSIVMMVPGDEANAGEMEVYKEIIETTAIHKR